MISIFLLAVLGHQLKPIKQMVLIKKHTTTKKGG